MNIQTSTAIQDVARTLMTALDANKDGQLSGEEFTSFLSKLMSGATDLTGTPPAAATPTPTPTPAASGPIRFEGFNFNQDVDPARSAKYAFAAAAQRAGSMPQTKTEAESWFNSTIKPELELLGHKVNWVKGDKFEFTNWQGTFTIDFLRGADGPDPALAWQVE